MSLCRKECSGKVSKREEEVILETIFSTRRYRRGAIRRGMHTINSESLEEEGRSEDDSRIASKNAEATKVG